MTIKTTPLAPISDLGWLAVASMGYQSHVEC